MAALLYMGDFSSCRHLWRRHRDAVPEATRASLEAWWDLGRAMMEYDFAKVWPRLAGLKQQPQPFCIYAQEISDSFCRRLIPKLSTMWGSPSDTLLGLSRQEWIAFLEQHRKEMAEDGRANADHGAATTEIISYLECPSMSV
jgi:TorA maturation chaperone TorD